MTSVTLYKSTFTYVSLPLEHMTCYHSASSFSYGASTQSNPFAQGGWKAIYRPEDDLNCCNFSHYNPLQYHAYPRSVAGSPRIATKPTSTKIQIKFTPSTSTDNRLVNCTIVGAQDRVLYRGATENPSLTIIKDSKRHPVALIEWSSIPVVDIRGDKGKKPFDQWLIPDRIISYAVLANLSRSFCSLRFMQRNMQLMQWKGVWYSWTAGKNNLYVSFLRYYYDHSSVQTTFPKLHVHSQYERPLAIVGISGGSVFEAEFTADAMDCGLLEPSLVAIILIRWRNGYIGWHYR